MSTHLRAYRKVTALLYRMRERSRIAEDAWDRATSGIPGEPENTGQWPVGLLNFARNKAVELIAEGNHFLPERSRAIAAIDEAVRSAFEQDLRASIFREPSAI
jgi:hypothetical protein